MDLVMRQYWISFLLIFFFDFTSSYASDIDYRFKYKDVYACSLEKFKFLYNNDYRIWLNTYIIHTSEKDDHYVIFHNGNEYPSFKKSVSTNLYIQAGGLRWIEVDKMIGGTLKFKLYFLEESNVHLGESLANVDILVFDKESLSAISKKQWSITGSEMLVCWDYTSR
jgi:hypothetical protein